MQQLSQRHHDYWSKNLRITVDPAGHLVSRDVRGRVLRARSRVQFLRVAVQLLGRCPGCAGRLLSDHLVLRSLHEQAGPGTRRRRGGLTWLASNRPRDRPPASNKAFKAQLNKVYGWYTGGFLTFIIVLAVLEQMGLPRNWIGFIFLLATVGLYAGIGIMSRTTDAAEYYVAGRRVPAIYNGMATGADWMSAASFIGMAGTLVPDGLRRSGLHHGLDRRLLSGRAAARAVPAQVRAVHDSRTSWVHATRATCRASSASSPRSCVPSPMWWRRSTAWA